MLTREQATAAVEAATGERDAIQANLLDLDGSFGKQLLAGAPLTGETRQRWETASAALAGMWETYTGYSAVIDRAAELTAGGRSKDLPEVTTLLTGPSVRLTRGPAPLARRDLSDTGREDLTLAAAVGRMRRAFTAVTEVVSAAEGVWNDVAGRLDAIGAELTRARPLADGLGDEAVAADLANAEAGLARQRDQLNSDPLALWQGDRADTTAADRLRDQVTALASRITDLARLRDDATRRIAALTAAAAAARAARADAAAACQRAVAKVAAPSPPQLPPDVADPQVARLDALAAAGRWTRLSSELDLLERELATATSKFRDTEREAADLLGRRDELRGLLDAYKAKAARLGAAEDGGLAARYDRARDLLWTAPCDLTAAADAVTGYQQAILAMGGQRR
jgi:hypothetical protein